MKKDPNELVVVMAFAPQWKNWKAVSEQIPRSSAALLIEAQWKLKRLARITPVAKAVAA